MVTITSPFLPQSLHPPHQQAFPGFLSGFMNVCVILRQSFQVHCEELLCTIFTIPYLVCIAYHKSLIFDGKRFVLRILNEIAYKPIKMH